MISQVIDSGAYSAWRSGTKIDVREYAAWLRDKHQDLWFYFSLDVIPGSKTQGTLPTKRQIEKACRESWRNYEYLLAQGLKPVPTFHQFEDFAWLDRIRETNPPVIGLSPNKLVHVGKRNVWCKSVFTYVCNGKPFPSERYHGLGVASPSAVFTCPWFSIDTINPIVHAARANITLPRFDMAGNVDWRKPLNVVSVTDKGRSGYAHLGDKGGGHERAAEEFIRSMGETTERLSSFRGFRVRFNFRVYQEQFREVETPRFRRVGFVGKESGFGGQLEPLDPYIRAVAAVTPTRGDVEALNQIGFNHRLLSYAFLEGWDRTKLQGYLESGLLIPNAKPKPTRLTLNPPHRTRPQLRPR
jgi:hypothetical protein